VRSACDGSPAELQPDLKTRSIQDKSRYITRRLHEITSTFWAGRTHGGGWGAAEGAGGGELGAGGVALMRNWLDGR